MDGRMEKAATICSPFGQHKNIQEKKRLNTREIIHKKKHNTLAKNVWVSYLNFRKAEN